jgi:hypothetical protein
VKVIKELPDIDYETIAEGRPKEKAQMNKFTLTVEVTSSFRLSAEEIVTEIIEAEGRMNDKSKLRFHIQPPSQIDLLKPITEL